MKKYLALLLALVMVFGLVACTNGTKPAPEANPETPDVEGQPAAIKIGVVLIGDENEGYTFAHMEGIQSACQTLGIDPNDANQVIWYYSIPEDESCYDKCVDLAEQGCTLVFTNSYGHQSFAQQAASEYPDVTFVAMTGDTAKASELPNFCNAFTEVYESRYVSGVVAGMKLAELVADEKLTDANYDADGNIKIGYVGAYPYAEVVSGYTAFFLGLRSIVENVSMKVQYTNSWFDIVAEGEAANMLIADGCCIISQHADSTGAPAACQAALEAGTVVYSVGYNVDMRAVAPDAALTSATNTWSVYYTYAISTAMAGEPVATNWAEGYDKEAVAITELGTSCEEGTAEKVAEVEATLVDGSLHVFDTATFTVGGEEVTSAFATDTDGDWTPDADEAVFDGYFHESYFQSAPCFALRIDGITELNAG